MTHLRLFGSAGLIVAGRVAGSLLTLYYTLLLVTVAPADEIGRAFTALSLGFVLSVAASLNVEAGSIRFLPLYLGQGRPGAAAGFVRLCRRITLAACLVLVPVAVALAALQGVETLGPYLLGLAAAPFMAHARINSRHANALGLVLRGALPRLLLRPALLSAVLTGCAASGTTLSASAVMGVFLAAAILTALLQRALIRSAMHFDGAAPDQGEARDWLGLGLLLGPMLLLNEYGRDIVILSGSLVLPPAEVARLGIALSLVGTLGFALTAVDMVVSPRLSRALLHTGPAAAARLLTASGAIKLAGLLAGAPLGYLLLPPLLRLMGGGYGDLGGLYLALLPIPFAMALCGPGALVLNILGHRWALFWASLAGALLLVAAVAAGGLGWGLTGAVTGAVTGTTAYHLALLLLSLRRAGTDPTLLATVTLRAARAATPRPAG